MNELIKINTDNEDRPTVSGRELHALLDIKTEYAKWFERICEFGFSQGIDFSPYVTKSTGGRPSTDHQLTIDMAKQICMIQRTPIGRQYREYFLEVERQWNNPEAVMARALKIADKKLIEATTQISILTTQNEQLTEKNEELNIKTIQQEQQIGYLRPAAEYTNRILTAPDLLTATQIAKEYGVGAHTLNQWLHEVGVQYKQNGQWLLYSKYQGKGYTQSVTAEYTRPDGGIGASMQTKWTQKGREFIYRILKERKGIVPIRTSHTNRLFSI